MPYTPDPETYALLSPERAAALRLALLEIQLESIERRLNRAEHAAAQRQAQRLAQARQGRFQQDAAGAAVGAGVAALGYVLGSASRRMPY